jgi:hypothetical protein
MKKIAVLVIVFALLLTSTAVAPPLVTVFGSVPYTETVGNLGGADYLIRIPDPVTNWNGGLVIYCRGYTPTLPSITAVLSPSSNVSRIPIGLGYAVAFSNFGEGGFCVQKAIIRAHQLTEWVVNNYGVTGKICLVGVSMGGNVALQLGAKYPDLYDGVLDLCGPKDMSFEYNDKMYLASLSDSALQSELTSRGVTTYPLPNPTVFKAFCQMVANDIAIECGGTPDSNPKAYERASPTYNAVDVAIPTITLQGRKDSLVPYTESVAPYSAFYQLVDWVEDGIPASPSS